MKNKDMLLTITTAVLFFSSSLGSFFINHRDKKHHDPIVIEKIEDTETTSEEATDATKSTEPLYLDLNLAGHEELQLLPGIGESLAQRIIDYRTSEGRFRNIEELMNVNGIGQGIFDGLKQYIFVADPVYEPTTAPPTIPWRSCRRPIRMCRSSRWTATTALRADTTGPCPCWRPSITC